MQKTEQKNLSTAKNTISEKTQSTGSENSLQMSGPGGDQQRTLSTDMAQHLLGLMKKVTEPEVTPKTVSAACQCAGELYKIMKLNLELRKLEAWKRGSV